MLHHCSAVNPDAARIRLPTRARTRAAGWPVQVWDVVYVVGLAPGIRTSSCCPRPRTLRVSAAYALPWQ